MTFEDRMSVPETLPNSEEATRSRIEAIQKERSEDEDRYTMRISRRTVDKLGVKLYDRASAVVAELVANSYDADAERVCVRLPLSTLLGRHQSKSTTEPHDQTQAGKAFADNREISDKQSVKDLNSKVENGGVSEGADENFTEIIEVQDDGHGMEPEEADKLFLTVGQDRRTNPKQGAKSRVKKRPVMGRKGIGKLAPFGICNRIEVISSGGEQQSEGYLTSHFILDYTEIIQDTEKSYYPERGEKDRTFSDTPGTTIRLSAFQRKRVPAYDTFLRQLARRFGAQQPDFTIIVEDTRNPRENPATAVKSVDIPVVESTRIDLAVRSVPMNEGSKLPVTGWIGMAKKGYKHEELAGVRIYARNKIVATTRDFGLMSGFTGENTLRSYLVGEIHAEWLDEDTGEDLIKTDRQDILWESERGQALRSWGQDLLREIGTRSRAPRRRSVRDRFLKLARVEERARERYSDETVVATALELASVIGGFAAEDELTDEDYVNGLCEVILSVAPHRALMNAFHEFRTQISPEGTTLESLLELFDKTRVAELASYSQIAMERVTIIEKLREVVTAGAPESALQRLISKGPWLIDPTWSVITKNRSLRTFTDEFRAYWRRNYGEDVEVALIHERSQPDFTAMEVAGRLRVIELKAPGHTFRHSDFGRLQKYVVALRHLFEENNVIRRAFPDGWQLDLVADNVSLTNQSEADAFASYVDRNEVERITWTDFVARAEQANSQFLDIRDASREVSEQLEELA